MASGSAVVGWFQAELRVQGLLHGQADLAQANVLKRLCLLRLRSLRRHDCVFRGFGYPEFHNLLRGNLDRCASRGITAHPRLSVNADEPPDSRNDEDAVLLDLSDGRVGDRK